MKLLAREPGRLRWWIRATVAAAATVAVTIGALAILMRWDRVRWDVPFEYDGDSLLVLALVQTTLEQPWYLETPRLGAPFGSEMYDYPCADTLDIAIIKAIGHVERRPAAVLNLLYVLTFPLAALTMLATARRLGMSWAPASAAGVLFAFLPYHALRGEHHLFLSTYFPVPLIVIPLVEIAVGRLPFFELSDEGGMRLRIGNGRTIWSIAIAVLLGAANPYYAYFALLLLPVAGLVDLLTRRRAWGMLSAGIIAIVLMVSATANMLPSLIYEWRHGTNSLGHARTREDAENYGLKLSHLLLPAPDHQSNWNRSVRRFYHSAMRPLENENTNAALGLVAAVGFVGLIATLLVPRPGRWPELTALAQLNLAAFLIGMLGGIGVLVNLAFSQFRCYNRISIFIACFSLLAVAAWIDVGFQCIRRWPSRAMALLALASLVAFGVWDGATRRIEPDSESIDASWDADAKFVQGVERQLPADSRVFQLPVVVFPESPVVHEMGFARSLVGYLHSSRLEWSHAAMRGRPGAAWQAEIGKRLERADTLAAALAELERNGFWALWIDWTGYTPDDRSRLRNEISRRLGEPFASRPDGTTECYKIGPITALQSR